MARDLFNRYIWLVDTIRRYGRITRAELDACWCRSSLSDGRPMPRRTFHNYRAGAEEMFNIEIKCDPSTFEYYIDNDAEAGKGSVTDWLLNSAVTNDVLTNSRDVSAKIFIEDVPSAREHLAPVIEALRQNHPIKFSYSPYTRSQPSKGVTVEPYFLKLFRQRWYVTGRHTGQKRIKTYALDRMSDLQILSDTFVPDQAFDAREYSRHAFGIIFTDGPVHDVALFADTRQAKYLRALPLHPSQTEETGDNGSIFHYRMRLSADLVEEIVSHGPRLRVLAPAELRAMVSDELRAALAGYENP